MDVLLNKLRDYTNISDKSWIALKSILSINEYDAGSNICEIGQSPTQAFFLLEGYVRGYTLTPKGNQYNRIIYQPMDFMASLSALIQKTKANLALECLTHCKLIETRWNDFMHLVQTNPEIGIFYRKLLEDKFVNFELRNVQLVTLSALERYKVLRKHYPDIENYVSQRQIASFIGISPIQLSRIRKKLFGAK